MSSGSPEFPVDGLRVVPVVVEYSTDFHLSCVHLYDLENRCVHTFAIRYCRRDDKYFHAYLDTAQRIALRGGSHDPLWFAPGVDVHMPRPVVRTCAVSSAQVDHLLWCRVCADWFDGDDHCGHLHVADDVAVGPGAEDEDAAMTRVCSLARALPVLSGDFAEALWDGEVRWLFSLSASGNVRGELLSVRGEPWDAWVESELLPLAAEDEDAWRALWWLVCLEDAPSEFRKRTAAALKNMRG